MLDVPTHVLVRKVDLAVELQILSFYQERRLPGTETAVTPTASDRAAG